jgi:hypothetical protein
MLRASAAPTALPFLAATLSLAAPPTVASQAPEFPAIRLGEEVTGFLGSGGPTIGTRGAFTVYRFDAQPGTRYGVELESPAFDGYLILARPVGGITEFLREDDDGGEDTNARLRFSVDEAGPHLLIVQAYEAGTGGAFSLSLEERVLPPTQPPRPLSLGQRIDGRLTESSSVYLSDFDEELPYELWTFEGRGGESYLISLDSDDFDAYLEFGPMAGGEIQVTDTDDDGGGTLNAVIRVELPHDGLFGVRVRPFGEDEMGAYTLEARTFSPSPAQRRTIAAGAPVDAALSAEDAMLEEGSHYHEWMYVGRAGERVRISMTSVEVDPYLVLGREAADGTFQELMFNDDGPDGGLDSEIDFTLPADGNYLIRARSFGSGERGAYTLTVVSVP